MNTRTTGASHIYVILYVKWIEIYIYIDALEKPESQDGTL